MSAKLDQQTEERMNILFNTVFYIASGGLAFKKFSGLLDLQEKNGLDIGTQYHTDKKLQKVSFQHDISGEGKNLR